MDNTCNLKWLEWAKELQFLAQAGLTYTKDAAFGAGKRFVL